MENGAKRYMRLTAETLKSRNQEFCTTAERAPQRDSARIFMIKEGLDAELTLRKPVKFVALHLKLAK